MGEAARSVAELYRQMMRERLVRHYEALAETVRARCADAEALK